MRACARCAATTSTWPAHWAPTSSSSAELTGVDKGLAWYINWVKGWADYPRMYVGLIILVTFCRTLMVLLFKIRSSLLAWQQNLVRW